VLHTVDGEGVRRHVKAADQPDDRPTEAIVGHPPAHQVRPEECPAACRRSPSDAHQCRMTAGASTRPAVGRSLPSTTRKAVPTCRASYEPPRAVADYGRVKGDRYRRGPTVRPGRTPEFENRPNAESGFVGFVGFCQLPSVTGEGSNSRPGRSVGNVGFVGDGGKAHATGA
jgi:hypothetical protein